MTVGGTYDNVRNQGTKKKCLANVYVGRERPLACDYVYGS